MIKIAQVFEKLMSISFSKLHENPLLINYWVEIDIHFLDI
jgi:hypothetical protein